MKRDMDLVRKILIRIEDEPSGFVPDDLSIEGYTGEQIGYHVLIMIEAGLLDGQRVTSLSSRSPVGMANRMTWEGHDFLDACREEGRWRKAKEIATQVGGITFEVFKQVLTQIMVTQATSRI